MTPRQYAAVVNALVKIERGGDCPRVPGAIGRFLRSYEAYRLELRQLAVDARVQVQRDGAVRGADFGPVTFRLLDGLAEWDEVNTDFGTFHHVLALCDELLLPVNLRLWTTTGGGSQGIEIISRWRQNCEGVLLSGNFTWIPPNVIRPGTGEFETVGFETEPTWRGAHYLRYTAEDALLDPYTAAYVPLVTKAERYLASLRILAGVVVSPGMLAVPYASRDGGLNVPVRFPTAGHVAVTDMTQGEAWELLLIREPQGEDYVVLDGVRTNGSGVVQHSMQWAAYLTSLGADYLPTPSDVGIQVQLNLNLAGIDAPLPALAPSGAKPTHQFIRESARRLRLPSTRRQSKMVQG